MILTKEIKVIANNKNIKHFANQGLYFKYGEAVIVKVEYITKYSKYKIIAKCESCGNENEISMQKYSQNKDRGGTYNCKSCNNITFKKSMIKKYGYDNPSIIPESIKKRKETCIEKYGNEYVVKSTYAFNKRKETCIKKYGVDHHMKIDEIKYKVGKKAISRKKENGYCIKDEDISKWNLYRRIVRKLTERNRNKLLELWDGYDYYDNEYIRDNFFYKHTDILFPSLDHKISIIYGFRNSILPENIANISNLCITKKKHNSSKGQLTEEEFKTKNLN